MVRSLIIRLIKMMIGRLLAWIFDPPLRAAFGLYHWVDLRLGVGRVLIPLATHKVPRSTNWFYVLGSSTLVAFIFQALTGSFLALSYVPAPNDAYHSLQYIVNASAFGHFIRGVHYWGASAMFILIFAHVARVFLTGAYKFPRELNWILGVGLLFCTIVMGFTGQLLVWNGDAYWAIVVGAEQAARTPFIGSWLAQIVLAGQTITAATLTRFYFIHVFMLPGLMVLLITGHLYLVVYQGISEWPEATDIVDPVTYKSRYERILEDGVPFFPDAAIKDIIFALFSGCVVIALALIYGGSPLGHKVDPPSLNVNPRPFWFLIWYFAYLASIPKQAEDALTIGTPVIIILWMVFLPVFAGKGQRAPTRRPWAIGAVAAAVLGTFVLIYQGYQAPWSPRFTATGKLATLPAALTSKIHGQALAGARIFSSAACISCHEIDGRGGIRGPSLDSIFSTYNVPELKDQILYGGEGMGYESMPSYGTILTPRELKDLVALFRVLPKVDHRGGVWSLHTAAPAEGYKLFPR